MKSEKRVNDTGEVFTPRPLIREVLDRLPNSIWFDPNKMWLEPSAGDGNFLVEIKARLLQAGHDERHILDNMLFSVELLDDNHWVLQHRLGYLVDGRPNAKLWTPEEVKAKFKISKIHKFAQDLNKNNPYHENLGLARDEVIHHINHMCWSILDYDMSFSRADQPKSNLPFLPELDLSQWPETDTPDIGQLTAVERMLADRQQHLYPQGRQIILAP